MTDPCPSPSQVNKAASRIRKDMRGDAVAVEALVRSYDVLIAWRAAHSGALASANTGLRSMVQTAGCDIEISQRLKRIPTILDKLRREPTMALASMQDIGGVRAVLNSIDEVRRVEARIKKTGRWSGTRTTSRTPEIRGTEASI